MAIIPLVVGFGGVNAAGRSSFHHGFHRTVVEALDSKSQQKTWQSLRGLTGRSDATDEELAVSSLIREIESQHFDHKAVDWNRELPFNPTEPTVVSIKRKRMPAVLPETWRVVDDTDSKTVLVSIEGVADTYLRDQLECEVGAAGQVPTGFEPGKVYPARSHPRGVQLGVYSATDALGSLGFDWSEVEALVAPDQISVYNGSCLGQLDSYGSGGMFARQRGKRVTSKNLPLGLAEMPADFMNAYVFGTTAATGNVMGACATFHYNLRAAVQDIVSGKSLVAIAGGAEAGVTPEVIDGFHTMGALGTKKGLRQLDGVEQPSYRRACRPFSSNCGFTIAESAQTVILMADELALKLGAQVFGSVPEVFVNADGYKKSISGPGVGNHITVAKGAGLIRDILGKEALQRSFVHAHGTGTPQNRVTESQIFSQVAQAFGIQDWPVAAIKCYLGHTLATAGGDQMVSALGTWNSGIIPGIATIDHIADDVHTQNLNFSMQHQSVGVGSLDACLLNAKGFGGNNATSVLFSPETTNKLLVAKHGQGVVDTWRPKSEATADKAKAYDQEATSGNHNVIYKFDHNVRDENHVHIDEQSMTIDGYHSPISLVSNSPLASLLKS